MKTDQLYQVDLGSIWTHERQLFLDGKSDTKFALKFWNDIQVFIVSNSKPDISFEDLNDDPEHYHRTFELFRLASSDLKLLFQNEFFFNNHGCYYCNTDLVITSSNENFQYWFSLKLRQLEDNHDILNFLNFQLRNSFKRNIKNFGYFLDFVEEDLLDSKIIKGIEKWKALNIIDSNSFNGNNIILKDRKYLYQVYKRLTEHAFISKKTSLSDFENIFTGSRVKNKIIWCGSNVELQCFVKNLYRTKFVVGPKNKWITAVSCFINIEGDTYITNQLRSARSLDGERKEILLSLFKHSATNNN